MFALHPFLFVCLAVYGAYCEVTLKEGVTQTVIFDGNELSIVIDNSFGKEKFLKLCFESLSEESHSPCPVGFARLTVAVYGNEKVQLTVNHQGQVNHKGTTLRLDETFKFIDGILNIMVANLPNDKTTVTLPNAEIHVPVEPTEGEATQKESHAAGTNLVIIIVVLVIVAFIIVIVGILVWFCVLRKPKRTQMTERLEEMPSQQARQKQSTAKKAVSKNLSISKSTTTTVSRPPVSPKQTLEPPVTASIPQTQSSLTTKSKRVNRRKSSKKVINT